MILEEGAPGDRSFKILSGEVIICKKSGTGHLVPIAKLGTGEIFGEMYLFDAENLRTASAIAVSSEVTVEVFHQQDLNGLFASVGPSTIHLFEGLTKRLKRTSSSYAEMMEPKQPATLPDGTVRESSAFIKRTGTSNN
jgi:CRP-like cAMP-binding protein